MSGTVGFVDLKRSPSSVVGKFLTQKGFLPAFWDGVLMDPSDFNESTENVLGILLPHKEKKHFFGLLSWKPIPEFIGRIWFKNESRNADDMNWLVEVYGRKHVDSLTKFAKELATIFDVNITVEVVYEESNPDINGPFPGDF